MMKITEQQIIIMIKEEIDILRNEINMCHDKSTGHFSDCGAGNVYSLSSAGADRGNVDKKFVQRGTLTKSKPRGDVPVVRSKFGLNTSSDKQGGRIKMRSGKNISPVRSVSQYPKKYSQTRKQVLDEVSVAMADWVKSQGSEDQNIEESSECDCRAERRDGYRKGIEQSLLFIQSYERSKKGEA